MFPRKSKGERVENRKAEAETRHNQSKLEQG